MKIIRKETYPIPSWAVGYLFNETTDNLIDDEIQLIENFKTRMQTEATEMSADADVVYELPEDSDFYFTWMPEFGLACDVYDVTVLFLIPNHQWSSCPKCGEETHINWGDWNADDDYAWRRHTCLTCNFIWQEVYQFSHNESLDCVLLNSKGDPISS